MPQPHITVYAAQGSPRLRYVLDWLLTERLGLSYSVTANIQEAETAPYCISYGRAIGGNTIGISAAALLWQADIAEHAINRRSWECLHTLYFDEAAECDIPFDMLSGIFYLLCRYEEYFKNDQDRHGRFPHTASILDIDGVLERPVVDEWVEYLRRLLERRWDISIPKAAFVFEPTYDIDIAWKYRHKGLLRNAGGALRDVASGHVKLISERAGSLAGILQDPWDAFEWLRALHTDTGYQPLYFILSATSVSPFDKNISPGHIAMQSLIKALTDEGVVGLHPSYYTADSSTKLAEEKAILEKITCRSITSSRQHYIRLLFPQTYRALIAAGIAEDYSMGYSTHIGFRAGSSQSFLWYDIQQEQQSPLRIHPFCYMDTTAHYDMNLSADQAFGKLYELKDRLLVLGGRLTSIFHNFSLGKDEEWHGWRNHYDALLRKLHSQQIA